VPLGALFMLYGVAGFAFGLKNPAATKGRRAHR
jgi:hypothetical protein